MPVFDKSEPKDGTVSGGDFTYDTAADAYGCAAGKAIHGTQDDPHSDRVCRGCLMLV